MYSLDELSVVQPILWAPELGLSELRKDRSVGHPGLSSTANAMPTCYSAYIFVRTALHTTYCSSIPQLNYATTTQTSVNITHP
jgi:hypothetical protein